MWVTGLLRVAHMCVSIHAPQSVDLWMLLGKVLDWPVARREQTSTNHSLKVTSCSKLTLTTFLRILSDPCCNSLYRLLVRSAGFVSKGHSFDIMVFVCSQNPQTRSIQSLWPTQAEWGLSKTSPELPRPIHGVVYRPQGQYLKTPMKLFPFWVVYSRP